MPRVIAPSLLDSLLPGRDFAFLHFLVKDPSQMFKYMGNPRMRMFFADRRCWFMFRLMESIFVEQGMIDLAVLAGEVEEGGLDDSYLAYFYFLADYRCPEKTYEEWRDNRLRENRFSCGDLPSLATDQG